MGIVVEGTGLPVFFIIDACAGPGEVLFLTRFRAISVGVAETPKETFSDEHFPPPLAGLMFESIFLSSVIGKHL